MTINESLDYLNARGNLCTLYEFHDKDGDGFTCYKELEVGQPDRTFTASKGYVQAKKDLLSFDQMKAKVLQHIRH